MMQIGNLRLHKLRSRGNNKIVYYLKNGLLDLVPGAFYRSNFGKHIGNLDLDNAENIVRRVDYYNKLDKIVSLTDFASRIDNISRKSSTYYYDLRAYTRYFPSELCLHYLFGDITTVPNVPTVLKSRPISNDNAYSVLLNLDKYRHFYFPSDPISFADKEARTVWRGGVQNEKRCAMMRRYHQHPLCDVGQTSDPKLNIPYKPFMRVKDQLKYKFILSIEGNDVATNLKWIMASNSLCLMPAPKFETWFMEGTLKPGRHYVQLRDDFADLEEKILYYSKHTNEAVWIIKNANAFVDQFRDLKRERLISLLVLKKYFEKTGQICRSNTGSAS